MFALMLPPDSNISISFVYCVCLLGLVGGGFAGQVLDLLVLIFLKDMGRIISKDLFRISSSKTSKLSTLSFT